MLQLLFWALLASVNPHQSLTWMAIVVVVAKYTKPSKAALVDLIFQPLFQFLQPHNNRDLLWRDPNQSSRIERPRHHRNSNCFLKKKIKPCTCLMTWQRMCTPSWLRYLMERQELKPNVSRKWTVMTFLGWPPTAQLRKFWLPPISLPCWSDNFSSSTVLIVWMTWPSIFNPRERPTVLLSNDLMNGKVFFFRNDSWSYLSVSSSVYTPYSLSYPSGPPKKSNDHPEPSVTFLPEMFLFDYGVVVFWGMTLIEEQRILKELKPFEDETLGNNPLEQH